MSLLVPLNRHLSTHFEHPISASTSQTSKTRRFEDEKAELMTSRWRGGGAKSSRHHYAVKRNQQRRHSSFRGEGAVQAAPCQIRPRRRHKAAEGHQISTIKPC